MNRQCLPSPASLTYTYKGFGVLISAYWSHGFLVFLLFLAPFHPLPPTVHFFQAQDGHLSLPIYPSPLTRCRDYRHKYFLFSFTCFEPDFAIWLWLAYNSRQIRAFRSLRSPCLFCSTLYFSTPSLAVFLIL